MKLDLMLIGLAMLFYNVLLYFGLAFVLLDLQWIMHVDTWSLDRFALATLEASFLFFALGEVHRKRYGK